MINLLVLSNGNENPAQFKLDGFEFGCAHSRFYSGTCGNHPINSPQKIARGMPKLIFPKSLRSLGLCCFDRQMGEVIR